MQEPAWAAPAMRPWGREWVERLARLGYAAKGFVYLLVGWIAANAAWNGGRTAGSEGALAYLLRQPFGSALLVAIAVGLSGYALWRTVQAILDPEGEGSDARALALRGYRLASALLHGALVVVAVRLLTGDGGGGEDGMREGTTRLMAQPAGRWLVALLGALVVVAAVSQVVSAARGGYRKRLRLQQLQPSVARWLDPVARLGLLSRAVVFFVVGGFLLLAARDLRPQAARGVGESLATLQAQPAGDWLLGIVAIGLAAYGCYQLVEARYRTIAPP